MLQVHTARHINRHDSIEMVVLKQLQSVIQYKTSEECIKKVVFYLL